MKYSLLICLFFHLPVHSQPFSAIDEHSLNAPNSRTRTIPKLAQYLAEESDNDVEKLRAIYAWITLNISYEDDYPMSDFWATPEYIEDQSAPQVLHNRSAVCQGYANLFCALAKELALPCEVVTGIVKDPDGSIPRLGHAWVAAKADGVWRLFDPTWGVPVPGSGAYTVNERYFMPPPERFVVNHLPDDPVWQLLEKPVEERVFRESSNAEISAYLSEAGEDKFAFRDTLEYWLSLDSVHRMLNMENRVLQFNGSNERAVFSLGQNYWGMFYDLHRLLDSLADETILQDSVQLDTSWFLAQTLLLEQYHNHARSLFDRMESPERRAQAVKFYSPDDVAALLYKLKGSMWTGQFERTYHQNADLPDEQQLDELRRLIARADAEYLASERTLNCDKIYNICLEIWHNRSLAYIQMAQREVYVLDRMLAEKQTKNLAAIVTAMGNEARFFFQKGTEDVHRMTLRPPVFALTRERQSSIQQGLLSLRSSEIRARRATIMPALEDLLGSRTFSLSKAEALQHKLTDVQSALYQFTDSLENNSATLGKEFLQNMLFNLQYETFALQYNLGTLRYRKAWHLWQQARQNNTLQSEKENIRAAANQVFTATREANNALNAVSRSGQLPHAHVEQRKQQVNKLKEAAEQLVEAL